MIHIISLGAGVQSSTMALMAAHGEIEPMPQCAIFADTGDEPDAVYDYLRWLGSGNVLPFPVLKTKRPFSLSAALIESADSVTNDYRLYGKVANIPAFTLTDGKRGILKRECTSTYKIDPLNALTRDLMKKFGVDEITKWLGISADEASRMKPAKEANMIHRFPLAMEHKFTREDCKAWMRNNGYPEPPRSACVFCPFHSDNEWRRLRDEDPAGWRKAVEFEKKITNGIRGTTADKLFLHNSCVPLDEVDLDTAEDHGQVDMFKNDCEGMCGV